MLYSDCDYQRQAFIRIEAFVSAYMAPGIK